ncbi:hypothetical protein P691DRAFT_782790 [Macrolepiota fuliginosa MF-IS2]|uniref:Uncharacterized protein n=1 Tax=Macrolepiota fuliginosa MF-IS2 TaxID=1400762 RepID=A0A9P5XAN0_9AGAR|nr:hypothetical protein P691DRAFT_782790 [Macrolepiota fuliginosa MF-IS2]
MSGPRPSDIPEVTRALNELLNFLQELEGPDGGFSPHVVYVDDPTAPRPGVVHREPLQLLQILRLPAEPAEAQDERQEQRPLSTLIAYVKRAFKRLGRNLTAKSLPIWHTHILRRHPIETRNVSVKSRRILDRTYNGSRDCHCGTGEDFGPTVADVGNDGPISRRSPRTLHLNLPGPESTIQCQKCYWYRSFAIMEPSK